MRNLEPVYSLLNCIELLVIHGKSFLKNTCCPSSNVNDSQSVSLSDLDCPVAFHASPPPRLKTMGKCGVWI